MIIFKKLKRRQYRKSLAGSNNWNGSWSGSDLGFAWSWLGPWPGSGSGQKSWIDNKLKASEYINDIKVFLELSKDINYNIRRRLVNNPNVNKKILDILAKDKEEYVSNAARLAKIKCLL